MRQGDLHLAGPEARLSRLALRGVRWRCELNYELHPLCTLFPRMVDAEFSALVERCLAVWRAVRA